MNEKTLYFAATIITIAGLIILFFYADVASIPSPQRVEEADSGKPVTIRGVVTSLRQQGRAYFLRIDGEYVQSTDVIIFSGDDLFLEQGNYVEVEGNTEEYNGRKEIIAQKVTVR